MRRCTRTVAVLAACAAAAGSAVGVGASPAAATPKTTIYVSPTGSDHNRGTHGRPLKSLAAAQKLARADAATRDVTVELEGGTYTLSSPLMFTVADSGRPGHPVRWIAAAGATPNVSGGRPVAGWAMYDKSKNIFVANVPVGEDSRQLYVNGAAAPRAAIRISRSAVTATATGFTINDPNLAYLATLPEQNRIEVESEDSFTDRYTPVQSISGNTITMQQPAWENNNFGYDVVSHPFAGGTLLLENSYSFLQSGQWYLDPTAGKLYYRAPSGDTPAKDSFVLPRLQSLVQMAGSYGQPIHDITFSGIQFSYSTWLRPGTAIGYADQQNGTFIAKSYPQPAFGTCAFGCPQFEAARNDWEQIPAAVQVAAARRIAFSDNTFAHLGQVGLGLGMDPNANSSGVGYGVRSITVHHNLFTDLGGAGVVVGGVQPNAHHPSDPRMTIKNVTIDNNFVTGVAEDYKDMSGILSTYADHTVIKHNEVSNLAYDGIDVGWGWGANDAGGSQDYANRGLYAYQPVYTTPTTLKNTIVQDNLIHATKKVFHDGGSIYNLSANPGAQISGNYIYDNQHTVGLYMDEGSRYVTNSNNVVQDTGVWAFTNASSTNNTSDNIFQNNWYNSGATQVATGPPHNNQLINNVQVTGANWPLAAQQVMYEAGIEPGLRTSADSRRAPAGLVLSAAPASVSTGGSTVVTATMRNFSRHTLADVKLTLTPPSGWTATPLSPAATAILGLGSTTASWRLTAPATATKPIDNAAITLDATYRSGITPYSASASSTVAEAGALTSLKSFGSVPSIFGQAGDDYAILTGGNDIWGAGGEHYDEYGTVYSPQGAGPNATVTVKVTAQQPVDPWSKAGLVIRNDVTAPGASQGYVVLVVTPGNGVSMQWSDTATPGYLDQFASSPNTIKAPIWLRLTRSGAQVSGYYSTDGTTWTQVGSTITLTGATTNEDAGMIATAHSPTAQGEADFSNFSIS